MYYTVSRVELVGPCLMSHVSRLTSQSVSVCLRLPVFYFFVFSRLSSAFLSFASCLFRLSVPSFLALPNPNPVSFSIPSSPHQAPRPLALTSRVACDPAVMAEGGVGACPQVFVVDSQANYVSVPSGKKLRWARAGQRFLLLLVGCTMLGLVVEGCLIYNLYKQMEVSLHVILCGCVCLSVCLSEGRRAWSAWKSLFSRISLLGSTS